MGMHWDEYWSEGHLTSFSIDFNENYEDEYSTFWVDVYASLSAGSVSLDLATGNLALPILGLSIPKSDITYYATDLSKISKSLIVQKKPHLKDLVEKIQLFDQTNIEKMEFEDSSFDLVTSMYGFEYSDIHKTLIEIDRILKPKGRFIAISHFNESIILKRNNKNYSCLKDVLIISKVFDALLNLSNTIGYVVQRSDLAMLRSNKKSEKHRKQLNDILASLEAQHKEDFWETGIPEFIQQFFGSLVGTSVSDRIRFIKTKKKQLEKHSERLLDLKNAAFDANEEVVIREIVKNLDMEVISFESFKRKNECVGLKLELFKA